MIELRQVAKSYKTGQTSVHALKNINFQVSEGDFIIIKGPSGSGKSTLLNILGLLDEPTTGDVILEGKKITFEDYDRLAEIRSHRISFIFQSFNLNPVLTLAENVLVPLMIRKDIPRHERLRRAEEWICNTGLESHKHHRPDELSGGQRQRVAIARAMVSQPRLVIADEPTANLDSTTARSIISLMKKLNEENGTAFVFATHDSLLEEFAKKSLVIHDGALVTGTLS
jgi:putative ABC transport system ATP-binding protein